MRVEPLTPALEPAWRDFVRGRERALFYASLEYRDLLARVLDAEPCYRVALEGERVRGVLPGFAMRHPSLGTVLNSLPYYGSNGGFITDGRPETARVLGDAWLALERELGCAASTLIGSPFDADPAALERLAPTFRDGRVGQVTPLPPGGAEEALFALYDETARRNVRKARKSGVTWRSDDGADAIAFLHRTHERNIRAVGGLPKARAFFDAAAELVPGAQRRLYVAEHAGERIAALLVFRFNATVEYYTPAIVEAARTLQPLALLVHEAMRESAGAGFRWWNWGGTWKSQLGVYRFKRKWGALDMPYQYTTRLADRRLLERSRAELLAAFPGFFVVPFDQLHEPSLRHGT